MRFRAVVIGASTGGIKALARILAALPEGFTAPVIVVIHLNRDADGLLRKLLAESSRLAVREVEDKDRARPGTVHLAPPGYHLLVEEDATLSLSLEPPVRYARPSIDVLFETAADAWRERLVGVILTGANDDGARGLERIRRLGGLAVVQDPATAEAPEMPREALALAGADRVLPLDEIGPFLTALAAPTEENRHDRED